MLISPWLLRLLSLGQLDQIILVVTFQPNSGELLALLLLLACVFESLQPSEPPRSSIAQKSLARTRLSSHQISYSCINICRFFHLVRPLATLQIAYWLAFYRNQAYAKLQLYDLAFSQLNHAHTLIAFSRMLRVQVARTHMHCTRGQENNHPQAGCGKPAGRLRVTFTFQLIFTVNLNTVYFLKIGHENNIT